MQEKTLTNQEGTKVAGKMGVKYATRRGSGTGLLEGRMWQKESVRSQKARRPTKSFCCLFAWILSCQLQGKPTKNPGERGVLWTTTKTLLLLPLAGWHEQCGPVVSWLVAYALHCTHTLVDIRTASALRRHSP